MGRSSLLLLTAASISLLALGLWIQYPFGSASPEATKAPPTIPPEDIPETPISLMTTSVEGLPSVVRQGEAVSFVIKVYCFKPECDFRPEITLTRLRDLPPPEGLTPGKFPGPLEVNLSAEAPVEGEALELVAGEGDSAIRLAIRPSPAFTLKEGEVKVLNATLEVGQAVAPGRYRINVIMRGALSKPGTLIETYDFEVVPGQG